MKPITQQNHYEVLEVSPDALPFEIRQAYKKALALYEDNAIASYSFFSEEERIEILDCIEKAYLTLINAEARAAYDHRLTALGILGERKSRLDKAKKPVAIYDFQKISVYGPSPVKRIDELKALTAQSLMIQNILAQDMLAGADLQNLRECLKVPLEEISHRTNIRIDILRAIENENMDLLPPRVYLKGFLKSYSRCLELDEQVVVNAYLKRIEERASLPPKLG
jgi:curved DNA-binding protein CbpA